MTVMSKAPMMRSARPPNTAAITVVVGIFELDVLPLIGTAVTVIVVVTNSSAVPVKTCWIVAAPGTIFEYVSATDVALCPHPLKSVLFLENWMITYPLAIIGWIVVCETSFCSSTSTSQ